MDRRRILVLTVALLLPLAGLEARLVHLQILSQQKYLGDLTTKRRSLEITRPARGKIYDRNGKVLAEDRRAFDLYLVLDEFERDPSAFERLADFVPDLHDRIEEIYAKIEKQMDARPKKERIRILAREKRSPYLLMRDLAFESALTIETGGDRYPGTVVREGLKRVYLEPFPVCHLTGYLSLPTKAEYEERLKNGYFTEGFAEFIGEDELARFVSKGIFQDEFIGRTGIEKTYDEQLRGKYGLMIFEREPGKSREMVELIPSIAGQDVHLSIDIEIQKFVLDVLARRATTDAAVVVLDPHTGEVIALVSNRLYDPNDPRPYMLDDVHKPMRSRAFADHCQLGSVFKIVPATAGLFNGIVRPDTVITCNGKFRPDSRYYNCHIWNTHQSTHGDLDLSGAMAKSCNIYFYTIGEQMGKEGLDFWARQFGFGDRTGLDLPGEASGRLPGNDPLSGAIGQGELMVTPLQVAVMMSVIANGGKRVTPHLRRGDVPAIPSILDAPTIDALRKALEKVVKEGTARNQGLEKWKVAGKTGSAQNGKFSNGVERPAHAWFAGYFPADAPKYAIAVLVENAGHGGDVAAPIVADIAERLMTGAPPGVNPK